MKNEIKSYLKTIQKIKNKYLQDGIEIIGVFGSYAKNNYDKYSDIDIVYKINYPIFFSKYKDGFSQILRLEDIKKELSNELKKKVDFVPFKKNFKEIIYV